MQYEGEGSSDPSKITTFDDLTCIDSPLTRYTKILLRKHGAFVLE